MDDTASGYRYLYFITVSGLCYLISLSHSYSNGYGIIFGCRAVLRKHHFIHGDGAFEHPQSQTAAVHPRHPAIPEKEFRSRSRIEAMEDASVHKNQDS